VTDTPENYSLCDFITESDYASIRGLIGNVREARHELVRISVAVGNVDSALTAAASRKVDESAAAAARFLGEASEISPANAPLVARLDPLDLKNTLVGLQRRQAEAEALKERAEATLAATVKEVALKNAKARLEEEYAETAEKLGRLWTLLESVQVLAVHIASLHPDTRGGVEEVPRGTWRNIFIPGSDLPTTPVLSKASFRTREGPALFSGEQALSSGRPQFAFQRFAEELEKRIGFWPFPKKKP